MLKKLLVLVLAICCAAVVVGAFWFYASVEERPDGQVPLHSYIYVKRFEAVQGQAEDWLRALYAEHPIPSLSAAVAVDGELVWSGAVGYRDLDERLPADRFTQYRVGSLAKPMTAVLAVKLQEQGLLELNRSAGDVWQENGPKDAPYSLAQLLSHQSGIRHYTSPFIENFRNQEFASTREAVRLIENDPLQFSPGHQFHYSTYGYTFAALYMEQAASSSFGDLFKISLTTPMGLLNTQLDQAMSATGNYLATPYLLIKSSIIAAPQVNFSYKYAGGGVLSTPEDVVKFALGVLGNDYISPRSRTLLWQPRPLANGQVADPSYGLGFWLGGDELGPNVYHGGSSVGGTSFFIIYPNRKTVVAISSNITMTDQSFDRFAQVKTLIGFFQ